MKFQELIREVARNPKNRAIHNFIKVQSGASMNTAYYEHCREEDIPASLSRLHFSLARLRLALLAKLGWRGVISFSQQWALWKDVFRGLLLVPFHGTKLRKNWLVRWVFRSRSPRAPQKSRTAGNPCPKRDKS